MAIPSHQNPAAYSITWLITTVLAVLTPAGPLRRRQPGNAIPSGHVTDAPKLNSTDANIAANLLNLITVSIDPSLIN